MNPTQIMSSLRVLLLKCIITLSQKENAVMFTYIQVLEMGVERQQYRINETKDKEEHSEENSQILMKVETTI